MDTWPPPGMTPEEAMAEQAAASPLQGAHIRVNQVGYLPDDPKVAIVVSDEELGVEYELVDEASGSVVLSVGAQRNRKPDYGRFAYHYDLDFSSFEQPGRYHLRHVDTGDRSGTFRIGGNAYGDAHELLLEFMRQQRCGYNPFIEAACHRYDGRSAYGPLPEGSFVDASGGWHDAGDQLKYLITSSFATAIMLLAYELEPDKFGDRTDALGRPNPNGVPDVLDEARWGLDWMHKLHPQRDHLYHQVADDRDHIGWKWPTADSSDYGWGPNSYRVVYFADGRPQGLREFKSTATGIGNLAGRVAAAMALGFRAFRELDDTTYAARSLEAARTVYALGRANEGFQQGNSYGAPYRYTEDTWADDMEWGAAELFRATGDSTYLADAKRYARMIGTTSWIGRDTTDHYQFYPFINVGHFALHRVADAAFQDTLAGYYREGLQTASEQAENAFGIGVPFIWCSNNLMTALVTQGLLYEKMTGDTQFRPMITTHRDWLLGRNPWGTSMFTGIPAGGEYPEDVHTSLWALTQREVPGGLVDGPVYGTIFNSLLGLVLTNEDEFAAFQTPYVVYHDDIGDYSTNEPTMDGTAGAIYMMAYYGSPAR